MLRLIFALSLLLYALPNQAAISIGTGYSGATSGRIVPSLYAALENPNWLISGMATGVQTRLYYHSAYQANWYFSTWKAGDFFWGEVSAGIGLGAFYAVRGYRETVTSKNETSSDFAFGPAIHVKWMLASPVFLAIEVLYGVRSLGIIFLQSQEVANLALGVSF